MAIASNGSSGLELSGKKSSVRVFVGAKDVPKDTALITGSMQGGFEWWTDQAAVDLRGVFDWVNQREDGAWIGSIPRMRKLRAPAGFIQSNLSRFYRAHHDGGWSGKVWKDFYFACFYDLLAEMDASFHSEVIRAQHPTLSPTQWSIWMQGTFLDALGHLVDNRELALREIYLGCPHEMTSASLRAVAEKLNREQTSDRPLVLDPIQAERVNPATVGCPSVPGLVLKRVLIRPAVS